MFVKDIVIALILGLIFALAFAIVAGMARGPARTKMVTRDELPGKSEVPAHAAATVNKLAFCFLVIALGVATFVGYMLRGNG